MGGINVVQCANICVVRSFVKVNLMLLSVTKREREESVLN